MAASFTSSFVSLVLICTYLVLLLCIVRNNDYNLRSTSQTRSVEAVASVSRHYHSKDHDEDHDEDHDKHRGDIFDYNLEMELKTSV